jgi:hypothetical protein
LGRYTFEVGGKGKSRKLFSDVENSRVIKDDIKAPVAGTVHYGYSDCCINYDYLFQQYDSSWHQPFHYSLTTAKK